MSDRHLELEETSDLMIENARMKAVQALNICSDFEYALGDDSGVFIRSLCYFPGVHSRRWFGNEDDDSVRNQKIIDLMANEKDRTTYLISCFVLVNRSGIIIDKETVKNKYNIAYEESGNNGFGYDKILIPSSEMLENLFIDNRSKVSLFNNLNLLKMTIAELDQEQKNAITYRARIAQPIKQKLKEFCNGNENI